MQSKRYQLEKKALFGNRNVCTCYIFLGCEIASAIKLIIFILDDCSIFHQFVI